MAYNALNNLIDAYIYANGVQAITGQILNGVLKQMVSQLGSGYHIMGVAGPGTAPEQNDFAMAYFAATAGEYTDFGGITLAAGEVAVLLTSGNGSWSKQTIYTVPTTTEDLENTAGFITNAVTDLVNYYTKTEVDTTLANYPTLEALATALADYYTKTEIDTILAGYTTNTALASALADYYNKNDIDGLLSVVNAALADRYTKSETDTKLADYYRKAETYDKDEVDSLIATLSRQEYIVAWDGLAAPDVSAIPAGVTVTYNATPYTGTLAASASTVNKIYMVWNGVAYDMYGTSQDGGYSWVPMGTTTVDLSQYATKAELSQLQQEVGDKTQLEPTRQYFPAGSWASGKFIYSNTGLEGNVSSDVSDCPAIDVSAAAGKTIHYYRITLTNASGTIGMAFYDSSNNYISGQEALYGQASTGMTDGEVLVPSNAKYARFSCLTASKDSFYAYTETPNYLYSSGLGKRVQDLESETEEIGQDVADVQELKVSSSAGSADYEIADSDGNVLMKLKDGEVETKNFNSKLQPKTEESLADYEIADNKGNILMRIRRGHIETKEFNSEEQGDNPLFGKKIVWFGTSIPAAGYPEVCGSYLGATVHNEAVGSSCCRMGYSTAVVPGDLGDPYGITGMSWNVPGLSLSMKQEEKYDICQNWTTARRKANLMAKGYTAEQVANVRGWGELLTGNPPADIMTSDNDVYRKLWYGCSYNTPASPVEPSLGVIEGKVDKYLNAESFPDLWVFDHGHNDAQNSELMKTIPTPNDDRTYFIGAMNYIIKHILSYNPRARFIFIGHYENDDAFGWNHSILCEAQQVLANYWDAPLYEFWKMSGLSRNVVITTNAYWDTEGVWHESGFNGSNGYAGNHYDGVPENIRQENGVWVHDMSLIWVHMLDGLHPFQDNIKDFIGHSMAKYISSLIVTF